MPPIKFWLSRTYGLGEEFQDSLHGHLGYLNGTILAILNLCVTVMLSIKFWLNPTYGLGGDVVWRISRWLPWRPSWILERNNFNNSESLCCSKASHQVLAQSHLQFRRSFEVFQAGCHGCHGGHHGYRNRMILTILNLYNYNSIPWMRNGRKVLYMNMQWASGSVLCFVFFHSWLHEMKKK